MDIHPACRRWFVSLAWLLLAPLVHAEKTVAVFSHANPEYVKNRTKDGKLLRQTYVFMQGRFLGGHVRDPLLEKTPFVDIARKLAPDLAEQEFYPSKSFEAADLLLLVHWGSTAPRMHQNQPRDNFGSRAYVTHGNEPGTAVNSEARDLPGESGSSTGLTDWARDDADNPETQRAIQFEADLFNLEAQTAQDSVSIVNTAATLGIAEELRKEGRKSYQTEYARTLSSMLSEERYFMIVVAYDAAKLRATKKLERQWVAKISVRSPGVNFVTAVDRMSRIGANYFGTTANGIQIKRPAIRTGDVQIGELIVIGDDEAAATGR